MQLRTFIANGDLNEEFHSAATIALAAAEANLDWLNENWEELHLHYGLNPDDEDEPSNPAPTTTAAVTATATPAPTPPGDGAGAITASLILVVFSMVLAFRS